jgi:queuine/archaeosine tRNA-ribosyltransferase
MSEWLLEGTQVDLLHLTNQELQALGVNWASYNLFDLFDRPGEAVVASLSFATLFPWHGMRLVDLSLPLSAKLTDDGVQYRSSIDGRTIFIEYDTLKQWANREAFSKVYLSQALQERLSLSGLRFLNELAELQPISSMLIDANKGLLYSSEGTLNIADDIHKESLLSVSQDCHCVTCQHYTRSYLHHLSQEVPALSQRLQQYHNLHYKG